MTSQIDTMQGRTWLCFAVWLTSGLFWCSINFPLQAVLSYPNITWQQGSTTLPETRCSMVALYSSKASCILLFGGYLGSSGSEKHNVWCFHTENDTFTTYDTLTLTDGFMNQESNAAFKIYNENNDEIIYMWQGTQNHLIKYNVVNKSATIVTSNTEGGASVLGCGCMVKHPIYDDILYYGLFESTSDFYSYNITNDSWNTLPSTNENHFKPGCVAVDSKYYVIGARGNTLNIEKINLLNPELGWSYTNGSLSDVNSDTGINYNSGRIMNAFSLDEYIFIVGGYDGSFENDVVIYDTNLDILRYVGDFVYNFWASANAYYNNTFYIFGGYGSSALNKWGKSISIEYKWPTITPTAIPSVEPSVNPSMLPSRLPTTLPSAFPSTLPTTFPSMFPTVAPVLVFTNETDEWLTELLHYFNNTIFPNMGDYLINGTVTELTDVANSGMSAILEFVELYSASINTSSAGSVGNVVNVTYSVVSLQEIILSRLINYTENYVNEAAASNITLHDIIPLVSSIADASYLLLDTYVDVQNDECSFYSESLIFETLELLDKMVNSNWYYNYVTNQSIYFVMTH